MRKLFASFILILACSLSFAQTGLRFGVQAGGGASDLRYVSNKANEAARFGAVPCYSAGAFVSWDFLRFLGVETGLTYAARGYWDHDIFDNKVTADYLQLPLILRVSPLCLDSFSLTLEMGGYAAYGISGKLTNEVSSFPYFNAGNYTVANRPDFGLVAGVSILVCSHVRVGVRASYGLCNISAGNMAGIAGMYNEAVEASIGWAF